MVQSVERGQEANPSTSSMEEGPALRDAARLLEAVERDEADAAAMRARLQDAPLPLLAPDELVAPHLGPGEKVHGLRPSAMLMGPESEPGRGHGGTLYLTSRRLVLVGQVSVTVDLQDIEEIALAGERLLVALRRGDGIVLRTDRPRTFRAEIAAAVRELRR